MSEGIWPPYHLTTVAPLRSSFLHPRHIQSHFLSPNVDINTSHVRNPHKIDPATTSSNPPRTMPPYNPTLPSPPPPPPLQPGSPQYNAYFSNPWTLRPPHPSNPPIPPPLHPPHPQIYLGKSNPLHSGQSPVPPRRTAQRPQTDLGKPSIPQTPIPDLAPRPVDQGGMSTYDKSGLTKWIADHSDPTTDRPLPKATAHPHRSAPPPTTPHPHRSTTATTPEPRSCVKKGVRFAPSVQARDDGKGNAGRGTRSSGTRIRRVVCGGCGVKAVDWMVDDGGYCDGCYREARRRR